MECGATGVRTAHARCRVPMATRPERARATLRLAFRRATIVWVLALKLKAAPWKIVQVHNDAVWLIQIYLKPIAKQVTVSQLTVITFDRSFQMESIHLIFNEVW